MTLPAQHASKRAMQMQAASTQVGLCRFSAVECCDVPVNIIAPRRIRRSGRPLAARAKLYLTVAAKERQIAASVTTSAKYPRDRQAALVCAADLKCRRRIGSANDRGQAKLSVCSALRIR